MNATTVAFSFPWGRYHATPWDRGVNEGAIEWPPSSWRILRALYATWKTRVPNLDDAVVHSLLDSLTAAPEYFLPDYTEAHTRHYYPDERDGTDKMFDAFVVMERGAELVVRWPVDLQSEQRDALRMLAERLPYLGRADSLCIARLLDGDSAQAFDAMEDRRCVPVAEASGSSVGRHRVALLGPDSPIDIQSLTLRSSDLRKKRLLDPPSASRVTYLCPPPSTPAPSHPRVTRRTVTAIRWAISTNARPSVHAAVAMAEALRQASLSVAGRHGSVKPSALLAGKSVDSVRLQGHQHAHFLAFSSDSVQTGPGRLDTLVIWVPGGLSERDLSALGSLRRLGGRTFISDFRPCALGLEAFGQVEKVAPELTRPTRVWQSFTPFAPPRHGRRKTPWADHVVHQVTEELERRGKPEPENIEIIPGGWLNFRRHRLNERRADARRAFGVRVTFCEPVAGPIAVGALSHFGLGLMMPEE